VHSIRFCRRGDVTSSSMGLCKLEELPRAVSATHSPGDIVMIVKQYMSDPVPTKVAVVMHETEARELRASFAQPRGVADRREIGKNVKDNLQRFAPRCQKQGVISNDASVYLQSWAAGTKLKCPRPVAYDFLNFEQPSLQGNNLPIHGAWSLDRRRRHWNVAAHGDDDDECDGDGEVQAISLDD
jgi:hypothetical protein